MAERIFRSLYTLIPALLFIVMFWAQAPVSIDAATRTPLDKLHKPARKWSVPQGVVFADKAVINTETGLPTRILHKASGIVLVLIPAGEFLMGSPAGEPGRDKSERQHRRLIRKPFYLGETEVTVSQFRKFVQATEYQTDAERGTPEGGNGKGAFAAIAGGNREWSEAASWRNPFPYLKDYCLQDNHPVVQVSWNDAQRFCAHFGLRLPTEAQWEYACRAGSRESFFWGNSIAGGKGYCNVSDVTANKRFPPQDGYFPFDDGAALLSVVGSYKPNAWKLRDMIGNVEEWCQDGYDKYPDDGADESAVQGAGGVVRGGSWLDLPSLCRSAARAAIGSQGRRDFIGFRVAMAANP
jgi:formylglycine-generating enzyme required for sulfatase activity